MLAHLDSQTVERLTDARDVIQRASASGQDEASRALWLAATMLGRVLDGPSMSIETERAAKIVSNMLSRIRRAPTPGDFRSTMLPHYQPWPAVEIPTRRNGEITLRFLSATVAALEGTIAIYSVEYELHGNLALRDGVWTIDSGYRPLWRKSGGTGHFDVTPAARRYLDDVLAPELHLAIEDGVMGEAIAEARHDAHVRRLADERERLASARDAVRKVAVDLRTILQEIDAQDAVLAKTQNDADPVCEYAHRA